MSILRLQYDHFPKIGEVFIFEKSQGPEKLIFVGKFANAFLLPQRTLNKKKFKINKMFNL